MRARCISDEASAKYGIKDGAHFSVYSREYVVRKPCMAFAACKQISRGDISDPMIRIVTKFRKSSKMAK
jgi:hypothetical protein